MTPELESYLLTQLESQQLTPPSLEAFDLSPLAEKILGLFLHRIGKSFEEWVAELIISQCDSFIPILQNELIASSGKDVNLVIKTMPGKIQSISLTPTSAGVMVALINQIVASLGKKKGKELLEGISSHVGRSQKISQKQLEVVSDFLKKVDLKDKKALDMLVSLGIKVDL